MVKITSIKLHNFKRFEDVEIDFRQADKIILNGRNGYGKTTLFDAVELVITGKIERYCVYNELHDYRSNPSQEIKPLVCDEAIPEIRIIVDFVADNGTEFSLMRETLVKRMTNPIDFTAFEDLKIKQEGDDYHVASEEEMKEVGLMESKNHYTLFNYISQEESTMFLKSKEAERADCISSLFDINDYEQYIKRTKLSVQALRELKSEYKSQLDAIVRRIGVLKQVEYKESEDIGYECLTEDENIVWDSKELIGLDLSPWVTENGLMDKIKECILHLNDLALFRKNQKIDRLNSMITKYDFGFYYRYHHLCRFLSEYSQFSKLRDFISSLTLKDMQTKTESDLRVMMGNILDKDIIEKMIGDYLSLSSRYRSLGECQHEMSEMIGMRGNLLELMAEHSNLHDSTCPICGSKYETYEEFLSRATNYGQSLLSVFSDAERSIEEDFALLKKNFQLLVVQPLKEHYDGVGLTKDIADKLQGIDIKENERIKDSLEKNAPKLTIDSKISDEKLNEALTMMINLLKVSLDNSLNYAELQDTYTKYVSYIKEGSRNVDAIERKRQYFIMTQANRLSHENERLQKGKKRLQQLISNVDDKVKQYKHMQSKIENAKQEYLINLVSQIECLFYIYSGRIMQDCHYGRGLFIRYSKNSLLFVSDLKGEVDALYNMSSGQLTSVVIAFTLTLNKIFSRYKFMAIDDPLQTLDDINFWGLIELLRHEFKDSFILMSTHEDNYASLLGYKMKKFEQNVLFKNMEGKQDVCNTQC